MPMADLWLSLGSNLGNREATLRGALQALVARGLTMRAVSSLYATEPQGLIAQPEFLNCVARMQTDLAAGEALHLCHEVEALYGRERSLRWGPRTLDIDILFYDNFVSADAELQLPHPRLWERAFVLAPLRELWPDLTTPDGERTSALLERLEERQGVRRLEQALAEGSAATHARANTTTLALGLNLKYTLCFCRHDDRLLMLLRRKPPHAGQWNGVGGKIEVGETPRACIVREVMEEAAIDLRQADELRFGGIVTWPPDDGVNGQGAGMYVYVAEFKDSSLTWFGERTVIDGRLCWQEASWVCDPANRQVVENIPAFLPAMLRGEPPREYFCDFRGDLLVGVQARPLLQAADQYDPDHDEQQPQDTLRRHWYLG